MKFVNIIFCLQMWSAMGSVMCIFEKNAYSANIECFILWGYLNNIVCAAQICILLWYVSHLLLVTEKACSFSTVIAAFSACLSVKSVCFVCLNTPPTAYLLNSVFGSFVSSCCCDIFHFSCRLLTIF